MTPVEVLKFLGSLGLPPQPARDAVEAFMEHTQGTLLPAEFVQFLFPDEAVLFDAERLRSDEQAHGQTKCMHDLIIAEAEVARLRGELGKRDKVIAEMHLRLTKLEAQIPAEVVLKSGPDRCAKAAYGRSLPPAAWHALHARFHQRSQPVLPPGSKDQKSGSIQASATTRPNPGWPACKVEMRSALDQAAASGLLEQILEESRFKSVSLDCIKHRSVPAVPAEPLQVTAEQAGIVTQDSLVDMRAAIRGGLRAVGQALAKTPSQDAVRQGATSQQAAPTNGRPSRPDPGPPFKTALRAAARDGRLWDFVQRPEDRCSTGFQCSLEEDGSEVCQLDCVGSVRRGWSVWGVGLNAPRPPATPAATQAPPPADTEPSYREAQR